MRQYTKKEVIQALQQSKGLVHLAARSLGCTPQTIYNHIKRSEEVRAAIEDARAHSVDVAELALIAAVQKQEAWAVQFMLKTLGKTRGYVERSEQVTYNIPPELMARLDEAAKKAGISAGDALEAFVQELASADSRTEGSE